MYPSSIVHNWQWENQHVSYANKGSSKIDEATIILIHGFGACKEHWRHNLEFLSEFNRVIAIDLLGFGASSKPTSLVGGESIPCDGFNYGMKLWAKQIQDFISQNISGPVVLIGNSIGGVVALRTASELEQNGIPALGVILIDCAQRSMDDKLLAKQPPLRRWGRPLLKALVRKRWITETLFKTLARASLIRKVLEQTYPSGKNIDKELVELLLKPARDPKAPESFRGFINLFDDDLAPDLLADIHTHVYLIWGENDPWEPVNQAIAWKQYPCVKKLDILAGLGHCPHDESPEQVNIILLENIKQLQQNQPLK
jgi:pimeloyl-ACP methyl ester carboxylesterase